MFTKKLLISVFILGISVGIVLVIYFLYPSAVQKSVSGKDCITLYEGGINSRGVVFLSYGYSTKEDFLDDALRYVNDTNGILDVKPFSDNKNKLGFYAVFSDKVVCGIEDSTLVCDDQDAKTLTLSCPNDYIFVLGARNNFLNFIKPIRSSSYVNLASINTADHRLVVTHEFGHIFGRLADEYVEAGLDYSVNAYKNCDREGCNKWKDLGFGGCFRGCGSINLYRSTDNGIMKNYFESDTYGEYNEWLLNNTLY